MLSQLQDLITTNNLTEILKLKKELEELEKYIPIELFSTENREVKELIDKKLNEMKPYTETEKKLQSILEIQDLTKKLNWSDPDELLNVFKTLFNKGANYVENELLPIISYQLNKIEQLEQENKLLKDRIVDMSDRI